MGAWERLQVTARSLENSTIYRIKPYPLELFNLSHSHFQGEQTLTLFTQAEGAELRFGAASFFFVIFVFVGVALKYASLFRMRFVPGHVSRPYASKAEWLARRTLNQLAWVRFPVDAYRTFFLFFLFFSS